MQIGVNYIFTGRSLWMQFNDNLLTTWLLLQAPNSHTKQKTDCKKWGVLEWKTHVSINILENFQRNWLNHIIRPPDTPVCGFDSPKVPRKINQSITNINDHFSFQSVEARVKFIHFDILMKILNFNIVTMTMTHYIATLQW